MRYQLLFVFLNNNRWHPHNLYSRNRAAGSETVFHIPYNRQWENVNKVWLGQLWMWIDTLLVPLLDCSCSFSAMETSFLCVSGNLFKQMQNSFPLTFSAVPVWHVLYIGTELYVVCQTVLLRWFGYWLPWLGYCSASSFLSTSASLSPLSLSFRILTQSNAGVI